MAGPSPARVSAAIALSLSLIMPWEGKRNVGYLDIVGVATYCFGQTGPGAVVGKYYSDDVCARVLKSSVDKHSWEAVRCITVDVPTRSLAAIFSFVYNLGSTKFCGSTLVRKLNAGDLHGACLEMPRFNRAGGKVVRGLSNRRAVEKDWCLQGEKEGL